jgi:hypothetical protein
VLTRSLQHVLYLYHLIFQCLYCLLFGLLFCVCFCLCDRVDDVMFEEGQEQRYEEENQQFGKEGKWTSPPTYSILSQ